MPPPITLLTDFGDRDGYVGVMKGIIAGICPAGPVIDLSHNIPPQNLAAARFTLLNAAPYFPAGTVHVVVVDPGVGTARRAIALQLPQGYLVGPDNGVLSGVFDRVSPADIKAVELTEPKYWRSPQPSPTFHGRDIFAPVAAHLAAGVALTALGDSLDPQTLTRIAIPPAEITTEQIIGSIQHSDHFGNLITTIPAAAIADQTWVMQVGAVEIPVGKAYGEVELGHAIALVGSHGWVEIAVNSSSAQARLRLVIGDEVRLMATT
ncbi:S-adenosyl-l-methionine hydroxide adenosyltransferase family protein [Halomicronema sp. CCY15110]|uniref:SAM hydrolase/SAM-dependent halogenase family protein n=1 Tax=Halomicronema sp. CCY15110 TaxID=2767773 RepID=UPI00194F781A|nr:SAM-dependent chlorinase/fluorinase [Halomicronema sp. CCY15110]